jgi:hypothetical protein
MRAANGKLFLAENGAGRIDMVGSKSAKTAKARLLKQPCNR